MTFDPMTHDPEEGNPVVFIHNGHVRATSRDVAEYFGKRHADVVRAIRNLIEAEPSLSQRTFALANYVDEQGKSRVGYDMDRDGFTLTAMGFTGPSALHFKWAYIQAFNTMEEMLAEGRQSHRAQNHLFLDWSLEEVRAKTAVAEMYRKVYGPVAAQWSTALLGFPIPPASMIEIGRQLLLDLHGGSARKNGESDRQAA